MLLPVSIEPGPLINLWFQVQHSPFWTNLSFATWKIFKLLLMHHLISGLGYFVGINRAWLYKEPKVSVLQANDKLVKKGECLTWNQRLIRGLVSIPTGGNILLLEFLFSHGEASDANIGIIANFV